MRQSGRNASMIEPNNQSRLGSGQAVSRRKGMVTLRDYAGAWRHASGPNLPFSPWPIAAVQLQQTRLSSIAQHFRRMKVGSADDADDQWANNA